MNLDTYLVQYLNVARFMMLIVCDTVNPSPSRAFAVLDPAMVYMRKDGTMTIRSRHASQSVKGFRLNGRTVLGIGHGGVVENLTMDLNTHEGRVAHVRKDAALQALLENGQRVSAIIEYRKYLSAQGVQSDSTLKDAKEAVDEVRPYVPVETAKRSVPRAYGCGEPNCPTCN